MKSQANPKLLTLARETRGITQSQLAKSISNLTQGNLSRMEKGILVIPEDTLKNIADYLNYPSSFFFYI